MRTILLIFVFFWGYQNLTAQTLIPKVRTGLRVLKDQNFKVLEGKRIGLLTNPTGIDEKYKSTVDILFEAPNVKLVALFAPEHGIRGNISAGKDVQSYVDEVTGLQVYSLYGKYRKPSAEMLKNVDAIVYDIQDIGSRSYTYISTMGLLMEAAAETGKEVIILDRPNPLGGKRVEGYVTDDKFISFISQYKIPYIYGLTCGELAKLLNHEGMLREGVRCKLTIVPMRGWTRSMTFQETGLPWVPTSPHIPHKHSSFYYPASGILGETPSFSIGVGYTLPFETFAAEWINPIKFAQRLNMLKLHGVHFRPISYTPYYGSKKGQDVHGVQVCITDYERAKLSEIQFYVMQVNHEMYPDKNPFMNLTADRLEMFDKACGSDKIRKIFSRNFQFKDIKWVWYEGARKFQKLSQPYYLYR